MKEIVKSVCHGGFSLSHKAFLRLRELGNKVALEEPDYGEYWDDGSGPNESFGDKIGSFCRDIPRDDPQLIQVVKELKKEANGSYAQLKIAKIPDDVEWQIEEYDGLEWVSEKHRIW